ncbi:cytochrome b/b6 domain-containing protein [Mucilaginibacter sp. BJC16-A38]|uniref:cytochrome b/b6 domain-containing protein n=1 Tax=Mucilaginibacter phenanthrenivorans TaxID=1234842 RepID=UPI0021588CFA|nr:cytochrome b/b6 domain-containing protein [Mucilaginibacter phenanthrenivorans]MCR8560680.1 cytochrome b/b6 domain-containing protein [Mucilaginibacter phenanthrenivorans]
MTKIEPVRMDVTNPHKVKSYSPALRLWHWLNMIIISGSLITVLINSTITDDHTTSALLKTELQKSGASVTDDQARSAAHALSDSVWDVHVYFGYCLAGLLVFRLILEFFQLVDQKFIRGLKSAYKKFNVVKKEREVARHELTVKVIYSIFYVLLVIMVLTGLFLAFEDALAAYKSIRHSVKEVHSFCMYLVLGFIVVHLAGVFLAERKNSKGIVSDMINGGNEHA